MALQENRKEMNWLNFNDGKEDSIYGVVLPKATSVNRCVKHNIAHLAVVGQFKQ
jgi:hypothetical protein